MGNQVKIRPETTFSEGEAVFIGSNLLFSFMSDQEMKEDKITLKALLSCLEKHNKNEAIHYSLPQYQYTKVFSVGFSVNKDTFIELFSTEKILKLTTLTTQAATQFTK